LKAEIDNAHMQTRMACKFANGNERAPHLLDSWIEECSVSGEVLKVFKTGLGELGRRTARNLPFKAIRRANGSTLVRLRNGNKAIEMNGRWEVLWRVSNGDYVDAPFADSCGAQGLPDGNAVVASYAAGAANAKLFEAACDKKIVWRYMGRHGVHDLQVLTTNGKALKGPLLKRGVAWQAVVRTPAEALGKRLTEPETGRPSAAWAPAWSSRGLAQDEIQAVTPAPPSMIMRTALCGGNRLPWGPWTLGGARLLSRESQLRLRPSASGGGGAPIRLRAMAQV